MPVRPAAPRRSRSPAVFRATSASGYSLTTSPAPARSPRGGGGAGTPVPTITAVQDAASNTPNIAQGSIFIVKGTNLSASGYTPFAPPRPTQSSGVKVTFTPAAGGTGTDAYLVYLYNQGGVNQIACILPSTVAVGNYNVTVTNGTASAPFIAQVVASKIGLFTQDSSGSGLASVQNFISASGGSESPDHRLGQRHHHFSRQARTGGDRLRYGPGRLRRGRQHGLAGCSTSDPAWTSRRWWAASASRWITRDARATPVKIRSTSPCRPTFRPAAR